MNEAAKSPDNNSSEELADSLIEELTCDDVIKCQNARQKLVNMGIESITPLIKTLNHPKEQVRWEAAKALGQIANPSAVDALIKTMEEDEDFDVRWVAAESLAFIGNDSLIPLLKAMIEHSDSSWFRNGAHHVIHNLAGRGFYDILKPVLVALEEPEPALEVPIAAENALNKLEI